MNQQIQILDGFEFVAKEHGLKLVALAGGQIIHCFILGVSDVEANSFYQHHQFDIEEYLVNQIEQECWNESGEIRVQSSSI